MLGKQRKSADGQQSPPQKDDLYAVRRIRKRKRYLRRIAVVLLFAVLLVVLYWQREVWIPKLEDFGFGHQNVRQSTGDLAAGNFPLYIYSDSEYQTAEMDGELLILSDAYLYLYRTDGTSLGRRQHAYGNAMLQTAGSYALVYESGGTHFRLESPKKTVFEKALGDHIIFGRIAADGTTALVTESDTSASKLTVFNAKGKQLYQRNCVEKLEDLSFRKDNGGCYAVSLCAEAGTLKSVVHHYDFKESNEKWASVPLDMVCISVYNTKGDDVFILGDTACCYLSIGGAVLSSFRYPDSLVCGDSRNGAAAIVLRNEEKRTNSLYLMNGDATDPQPIAFDSEVKQVQLYDKDSVLIQTRTGLETFSVGGEHRQHTDISDSYDGFLKIDSKLFMLGYDRIDRLDNATGK